MSKLNQRPAPVTPKKRKYQWCEREGEEFQMRRESWRQEDEDDDLVDHEFLRREIKDDPVARRFWKREDD